MGARALPRIARALLAGGRRPDTPVALIRWGTTDAQETLVGRLDEIERLAEVAHLAPPVVAVIGEVVGLRARLAWFDEAALTDAARAEAEPLEAQLREMLLRLR
jgi:uroporphyrinogen III methyltransferase / synthase